MLSWLDAHLTIALTQWNRFSYNNENLLGESDFRLTFIYTNKNMFPQREKKKKNVTNRAAEATCSSHSEEKGAQDMP